MKVETRGGTIMCSEFLCNAIVRKIQQRNQDSQNDSAPGIHFVKEKASASTISSAKTQNKKKTFYGDLATSNDWTVFQNSRHSQ